MRVVFPGVGWRICGRRACYAAHAGLGNSWGDGGPGAALVPRLPRAGMGQPVGLEEGDMDSSWSPTFSWENAVQSPWPGMSMKNSRAPKSSRLGNPRHSPGPAPHSRINLSSSQSAFFLDSGISNVYTDHEIDNLS